MKFLCGLLLAVPASALAANIGDTYQQLIAEKGKPKGEMTAGARRILQYSDATIEIRDNLVASIKAVAPPPAPRNPPAPAPKPAPAQQESSSAAQTATVKRELNQAVLRVQAIVNQPVTAVPLTPRLKVSMFGPGGWFHDGAEKPDFNTVDIRKTQETPYDHYDYVSSDLNPGVAFIGRQLEFNSMTKFFYTDRSLPKKKLSEPEMLEINDQYRIIGQCELQLNQLQGQK